MVLVVAAGVLHVGAHVLQVDARPRAADQHLCQCNTYQKEGVTFSSNSQSGESTAWLYPQQWSASVNLN